MQMPVTATLPEPRVVTAGRGTEWIAQGFGLFRLQPGAWIGILLVWIIISALLSSISLDVVNSFLNPVFLAGLMLGCDSQARGEGFRVKHLFAAFKSDRLGQLLVMTLWIWLFAAIVILLPLLAIGWPAYDAVRNLDHPSGQEVLQAVGLGRLLLIVLVAAIGGVAIAMAAWFAPALIVFRKLAALDALKLSFRALSRNWIAFAVYGLVAALVLIVAMIPLGLGLLIALPVLLASVYAGYRDLYPE